jgi:hypothetical protein
MRKRVDQGEPLSHNGSALVVLAAGGGSGLGDADRIVFQLIDAAQEVGVSGAVRHRWGLHHPSPASPIFGRGYHSEVTRKPDVGP